MAVILQCEAQIVDLPNPKFDDSESLTDQIIVKRSMTGGVFTYIKTNKDHKFKYSFSLTNPQRKRLINFFIENSGRLIHLRNWKNELWLGYITNDLANTQNSNHDNQVDLEFQGQKII